MNKNDKKYFEAYLKEFGSDSSMIGSIIKLVLEHEKRIISLEKNITNVK